MPPSRKRKSRSNPGRFGEGSQAQDPVQPRKIRKRSVRRSRHGDTTPGIDTTALEIQREVPNGHEQHASVDVANDIPRAPATLHDPFNLATMQAEGPNSDPNIAESLIFPVSSELQDEMRFNISSHPRFTNIGMGYYGGTHQRLEWSEHTALQYSADAFLHAPVGIRPTLNLNYGGETHGVDYYGGTHNSAWSDNTAIQYSADAFLHVPVNISPPAYISSPALYDGETHGLEWLEQSVSFAAFCHSPEQDLSERFCHPVTRKNALKRLEVWIDNPNPNERISWLHGPAGVGKSTMAQTIAHEYKGRGVVATFFFNQSDERNDGNLLFPTLAWQLADSIPAIEDIIVHTHLPSNDVETQFELLVAYPFHPTHNITSQLSQSPLVIIIDGLDECSDEGLQRRILTIIGNAVKARRVPLQFLICSRPKASIEGVLDQFKEFTLHIDLSILDDSNRDIEKYLMEQFSVIRSKRGLASTWPGPETIEDFVFNSSGIFISAVTVMRYISDEDCDPEEQLDIVRNLKPRGKISPGFAFLDELYLEILKRQQDQDFVKTFLALLVGRRSIEQDDLHEDDAMLMNVSAEDLLIRLRTMHSLLKFGPFIDVYHKSFLDFLLDSSRSGQYHVTKQGAARRYMELVVNSIVQNVSEVIKNPDYHMKSHFAPKFVNLFKPTSIPIQLPPQAWEEILHPLEKMHYDLSRKSNRRYCDQCHFVQVTDYLLSHLNSLRESGSGQRDFNMNFGRLSFGPAAVVGLLLTALAQSSHH